VSSSGDFFLYKKMIIATHEKNCYNDCDEVNIYFFLLSVDASI